MNVANEDAPPENVEASIFEEVVAPPVVKERSSEVEDEVVEPSLEEKSSEVYPEVVAPSSSVVDEPECSNVLKVPENDDVVLNDAVHESENLDHSESIVDEEPTNPADDQVNQNATIEIVDNEDENKPVDGTEDMSTEEKAVQYDVLKSEFSNLQNKFESLAKVL